MHSLKLVDYLHVQADNPWYNYYYIFWKLWKMSQNLSSAAVVIGALRVKHPFYILDTKLCEKGIWAN